jgi:hypothetical protein
VAKLSVFLSAFLSALLVSEVAVVQLADSALAAYNPHPASIAISSPENMRHYSTSDVTLSVTANVSS